jgi:hypothetical protein
MCKNKNAIATAGNNKPTVGTRMEGRKEAAIIKIPVDIDCTSDSI